MSGHHAQEPNISLADPGTAQEGPGRRLRAAREAAQLSIGQVAAHLRLDIRTLNALEADRYEALPAPIFVRGYLRSYARLLDLPPEPLVQAFDQHGLAPPSLVADIATPPQSRTSDLAVRLVTYAIIIGLAVLVGLWWQNRQPSTISSLLGTDGTLAPAPATDGALPPTPLVAPAAAPTPTAPPSAVTVAPSSPPNQPSAAVEPPAAALAAQSPVPAAAAAGESVAPATGSSQNASSATRETGPAPLGAGHSETAATTPPEGTEPGPTEASAEPQTPAEPLTPAKKSAVDDANSTPTAAPTPTGDRLNLSLAHESWIEVYDRDGKRLYYNLAKAGSKLELTGKSPFHVLFGYAGSTSVRFNGVPFDPTPFAVRGVARFVLSGPATPSGPQDLVATPPPPKSN